MISVIKKVKKYSEAYSMLPTLIILLSLSMFVCSLIAFEKRSINLVEQKTKRFDSELFEQNLMIEKEWFNVVD